MTTGAHAIGIIDKLQGVVEVTRPDGSTQTLQKGDPVYQDDIIVTKNGSMIAIEFEDGSVIGLSEDARMTLDSMVYDPETGEGDSSFTIFEGMFQAVSGDIAANNPGDMVINTPVSTIGIRGTTIAGEAAEEGQPNSIVLLPNDDGTVGAISVATDGGVQAITQPNTGLSLTSKFAPLMPPAPIPSALIQQNFGSVMQFTPTGKYEERRQETEQQQQQQQAEPQPEASPDANAQQGEASNDETPPDAVNGDEAPVAAGEETPPEGGEENVDPEGEASSEEGEAVVEAEPAPEGIEPTADGEPAPDGVEPKMDGESVPEGQEPSMDGEPAPEGSEPNDDAALAPTDVPAAEGAAEGGKEPQPERSEAGSESGVEASGNNESAGTAPEGSSAELKSAGGEAQGGSEAQGVQTFSDASSFDGQSGGDAPAGEGNKPSGESAQQGATETANLAASQQPPAAPPAVSPAPVSSAQPLNGFQQAANSSNPMAAFISPPGGASAAGTSAPNNAPAAANTGGAAGAKVAGKAAAGTLLGKAGESLLPSEQSSVTATTQTKNDDFARQQAQTTAIATEQTKVNATLPPPPPPSTSEAPPPASTATAPTATAPVAPPPQTVVAPPPPTNTTTTTAATAGTANTTTTVNPDVVSSVDYALVANEVNLTLSGSGHIDGTGNAAANLIVGNASNNRLSGGDGADTLLGGAGKDWIYGDYGSDSMMGEAGNDMLVSEFGSASEHDTLDGGAGDDFIVAQDSDYNTLLGNIGLDHFGLDSSDYNSVDGGDGVDTIYLRSDDNTGSNHNTVLGGAGNDYLEIEHGSGNSVVGGAGADEFRVREGSGNTLVGGADGDTYDLMDMDEVAGTLFIQTGEGYDTIKVRGYSNANSTAQNITVTAVDASGTVGNHEDSSQTVLEFHGIKYSDLAFSQSSQNLVVTYPVGGTTQDSITLEGYFDAGVMINRSFVFSFPDFPHENYRYLSLASYDTLADFDNSTIGGGDGTANLMYGTSGDNYIDGQGGFDTIIGGKGNDYIIGGTESDSLDGGEGFDTVSFETNSIGMDVYLESGMAQNNTTAVTEFDTIIGFEGVIGSYYNDSIIGDANDNILEGRDGNDTISGGAGNDLILGGLGSDSLDGGAGEDTISFAGATTDMTISLGGGYASDAGAVYDTITGFEAVEGSGYNDIITGNISSDNILLSGRAGNDQITGGYAKDVLIGGEGVDTLDLMADSNQDVIRYHSSSDVSSGADYVYNFKSSEAYATNEDILDISGLIYSGDTNYSGNSFEYFLDNGYLILDDTSYAGDVLVKFDADGSAGGGSAVSVAHLSGISSATEMGWHNFQLSHDAIVHYYDSGAAVTINKATYDDDFMIVGSNYDDVITGGTGRDTIDGGAGNDTISGGSGDDVIYFNTLGVGSVINGGDGYDALMLGDNVIDFSNSVPTIQNIEVLYINSTGDIKNLGISDVVSMSGSGMAELFIEGPSNNNISDPVHILDSTENWTLVSAAADPHYHDGYSTYVAEDATTGEHAVVHVSNTI